MRACIKGSDETQVSVWSVMAQRVFKAQRQLEGGGFEVARPFPSMALPDMDPFLLLDQMGPADPGPGEAVGAPDHPHRGFETVTYMLDGEIEHKDSHGNHGVIRPGGVQWMTAGAGVIHSEMPSEKILDEGGHTHGVQLWVNLPAADKMMPPRYQELDAADIPRAEFAGGWVKVISGRYKDTEAAIDTRIPIQYLHVHLDGGATEVDIPEGHNAFAYVLLGEATVDGETVPAEHIIRLDGGTIAVEAGADTDVLVLSGPPLGEPVSRYGPFVMNTREEIYQAVRDFQAGRFGQIPPDVGGRGAGGAYLPGRDEAPTDKA